MVTGSAAHTSFAQKLLSANWGPFAAAVFSIEYWSDILRGVLLGFYPASQRLGLGGGNAPYFAAPFLLVFVFLALLRRTEETATGRGVSARLPRHGGPGDAHRHHRRALEPISSVRAPPVADPVQPGAGSGRRLAGVRPFHVAPGRVSPVGASRRRLRPAQRFPLRPGVCRFGGVGLQEGRGAVRLHSNPPAGERHLPEQWDRDRIPHRRGGA